MSTKSKDILLLLESEQTDLLTKSNSKKTRTLQKDLKKRNDVLANKGEDELTKEEQEEFDRAFKEAGSDDKGIIKPERKSSGVENLSGDKVRNGTDISQEQIDYLSTNAEALQRAVRYLKLSSNTSDIKKSFYFEQRAFNTEEVATNKMKKWWAKERTSVYWSEFEDARDADGSRNSVEELVMKKSSKDLVKFGGSFRAITKDPTSDDALFDIKIKEVYSKLAKLESGFKRTKVVDPIQKVMSLHLVLIKLNEVLFEFNPPYLAEAEQIIANTEKGKSGYSIAKLAAGFGISSTTVHERILPKIKEVIADIMSDKSLEDLLKQKSGNSRVRFGESLNEDKLGNSIATKVTKWLKGSKVTFKSDELSKLVVTLVEDSLSGKTATSSLIKKLYKGSTGSKKSILATSELLLNDLSSRTISVRNKAETLFGYLILGKFSDEFILEEMKNKIDNLKEILD